GIILSHNHPTGTLSPSDADISITKKLKEAAKSLEINLLDHIIITKEGHYSFSDEGLNGIDGSYNFENSIVQTVSETRSNKKEIILLDLFSGTGGFSKGLEEAGFKIKKHYFSEIDKYAVANYQYHFRHGKNLGDIKKIKGKQIERPDIITFGSPCQDISLAGNRNGLKGKRSGLFFEAIRLIKECKPRIFIFENVKGLFSSNEGKDFEVVLKTFAELGLYDIQWQLLNTRWFLPQNRERAYFIGTRREESRQEIFPIGEHTYFPIKIIEKGKKAEVVSTLTTTISSPSFHCPFIVYPGHKNLKHEGSLRKFTPLECERLQGFPDNWTDKGLFDGEVKPISDYQRYRMLGNAVSVPVVKAIGERLLNKTSRAEINLRELEEKLTNLKFAA
ncbi:MAG TPA: DNA (cytosine-5-)-methyltransferase, partial [Puia sp.]|nr:DNA (cytosine-5-)-methyltransferase [Puia sp.]